VARKLDPQIIERLNSFAVGDCIPDLTFVLDVDANTVQARMRKPRRPDRMEQEPAEFYEQVRQAYRQLAVRESRRVVLIDASHTADTVEDQIWTTLISRFPALMKKSAIRNPQSAI